MKISSPHKSLAISIIILFLYGSAMAQQATLTVNQDAKIATLLELKKSLEKDNKLSDGYTIQLYYGELTEANYVIKKYRGSYSNWPASIEYETPNYKVWVGNYSTRLDADRALVEIQRNFPSAFILKPERRK
ncbi:SPOR domain-containing protein [Altibacter sp.]|uniref:SPOR domain-containing protein n=1 Tax=Altibacter sp. TaxID=2024823 RepID=UPI000C8FD07B|nr:SPOR domain-containing protein [Altibacter sp.]MAP53912.1 translation initiation factor IF-2 [Altibacter sp.]|tara:strand:+ start:292 stop:687 length:396 start_codon:yes stop_codon:yes gene_type:complete